MVEMVHLKANGTVVIPQSIRRALGLTKQEPLVLVTDQDTLLLKRLGHTQLRREIKTLIQTWHRRFRGAKLRPKDIQHEVAAARRSRP